VVSEETEADTTTSRTETRETRETRETTSSSSQRGSSSTEEPPEEEEATPAEGASTTSKEATEVDSTKQVPGEASREAEEVPEGEAVLDIITERKRTTKVTADPASSPSTPLERATEADAAVTPWREAAEACP